MLRLGFIGTGRVSTLHAIEYLHNPRARIAAAADIDISIALDRGRSWGVADDHIVTDYHDLLEMPDVDAVEILLPHHLHHRVTLEAIAAGKHVSVQKPIASSVAQADEMIAAARAAGLRLKVYENIIFYPPFQRAKSLIEGGEIGDLIAIRHKTFAGRSANAWDVPPSSWTWRADRELSGGGQWLTDDGHHSYSLAWFFFGLAQELFVWTGTTLNARGATVDAPALVTFRFAGNRLGSWEATVSPDLEMDTDYYAADDVVEITGTRGVIWVTRCLGKMLGVPPVVLFRDGAIRTFTDMPVGWEQSFIHSTRDFIESFSSDAWPILSGEQGRDILRWCLAAEESARTGQRVAI